MKKKVAVFVLSSERSGSTWVGYVLGSHKNSAFLGEYFRGWNKDLSVPCTVCAANGLAECEVLHGIEDVPLQQAFTFAFERTGKQMLVDISKSPSWAGEFAGKSDAFDVRLIHLVRDPRGWAASERRRAPQVAAMDLIKIWLETNSGIQDFARNTNCECYTVFYDDLASNPSSYFDKLFDYCGLQFDPESLKYWNFTHHGFAANGASSSILSDDAAKKKVPHFLTQDDAFYAANNKKFFHDNRWKNELSPEEAEDILNDPETRNLLRSVGKKMTGDGLVDVQYPFLRRLRETVHRVFAGN
jgi:hypothetical protein